MATKPKARGSKKPKAKKMTQAEQSERFIETARQLGAVSGKPFEEALSALIANSCRKR